MPNDNVQTLTGQAVLDAPIRNAQSQSSESTNVCTQEAQSTWGPRQQSGDNVTTQLTQSAEALSNESKCGGYPPGGRPGIPKCSGLPSLDIDGLDSNMGPFDPNAGRFGDQSGFDDFENDYKNGSGKGGKGGCTEFEPKPDLDCKPNFGNKPEYGKPDHCKEQFGNDDIQSSSVKNKLGGSKCGGANGAAAETHTTQRRMAESESIIEQKIIEQKLREMKLRERYRL
ncbi:MAG: hypothetical protein IT342_24545 [Candidatus Melainabacteria bacterium]|nr:hypothetical protein [Candidatus Melainabacteria bacterium]